MDQVTFNYQQDNDHRGDWDWDDKQRKDDDHNSGITVTFKLWEQSAPFCDFRNSEFLRQLSVGQDTSS